MNAKRTSTRLCCPLYANIHTYLYHAHIMYTHACQAPSYVYVTYLLCYDQTMHSRTYFTPIMLCQRMIIDSGSHTSQVILLVDGSRTACPLREDKCHDMHIVHALRLFVIWVAGWDAAT